MAKYQYTKKYAEGSNVTRGRFDQLKRQERGPEKNFGNFVGDVGKWALNQALTPIETVTGRNFYDPEFTYSSMNKMDAVTSGISSAATDIAGTYFLGPFYTGGKKAIQAGVNVVDSDGSWDNTNAQVAAYGSYARAPRKYEAGGFSFGNMFNQGGGGGGLFGGQGGGLGSIMNADLFGQNAGGGSSFLSAINPSLTGTPATSSIDGITYNEKGNIDLGASFKTHLMDLGIDQNESFGSNLQTVMKGMGNNMASNAGSMNLNQWGSTLFEGDPNTMAVAGTDAGRNTRNWSGLGNFINNMKSDTVQESKAKDIKQEAIKNANEMATEDSDMMMYSSEGAGNHGVVSQGNVMNNAYTNDAIGTQNVKSGWADKVGQGIAQVGDLASNFVGGGGGGGGGFSGNFSGMGDISQMMGNMGNFKNMDMSQLMNFAEKGGNITQNDPTFKMWYAKNARRPDVMKAGNTEELKALFLKDINFPGNEMPIFSGEIDGYGNIDKSNRSPEISSRMIGGMNKYGSKAEYRHGSKAKYGHGSNVSPSEIPPGLNMQDGVLNVPSNYEGYFTIPGKDHEDGGTLMSTPAEGQGNTLIEAELNEGAEVTNGETYIYSKTTKHPDTGETFKKRKDKREAESLRIDKLLADPEIQKDEYKINALTRRKTTLLLEEESDRTLQDNIKAEKELKETLDLENLIASNTNITKKGTYRKGSKVRKLSEYQKTMLGQMLAGGMVEQYQNASEVKKPNINDYKWNKGKGGWLPGKEEQYKKDLEAYNNAQKETSNTQTNEEVNVSPDAENPINIPAENTPVVADSSAANTETFEINNPYVNPQPQNTDDDLPFSTEIDANGNTRYMVNGIERTAEEYDALVKEWNNDPENFATIPMAPGQINVETQTEAPITTPPVNIEGQSINLEGLDEEVPNENTPNNPEETPSNTPNFFNPDGNPLDIQSGDPMDNLTNDLISSIDSKKVDGPTVAPVQPNTPPNEDLWSLLEEQRNTPQEIIDNRTTANNENNETNNENNTEEEANPNDNNNAVANNTENNNTENTDPNAGPDGISGTEDDLLDGLLLNEGEGEGEGTGNEENANNTNNTVADNTNNENNQNNQNNQVVVSNEENNQGGGNNNTNNNNNRTIIPGNNNQSSSSSSSYKFMNHNINPYDWLGAAGLTYGALAGRANTEENWDKTTPNINFMKDIYKKPIHRLNMNTEIIDAANMNTDRQLREDLNTQLNRIRTSGNSFQNVDARSQNAYNTYASNAIDADVKYGLMNLGLQKDIADLEGKDRLAFLEGEQERDLADRKDLDNYYTQRGVDIQNTAKNMMELAKNGNNSAMEWLKSQGLNNAFGGGGNDPLDLGNGNNTTNNNIYNFENCPDGNCPDGTKLDKDGNVITNNTDPNNNNTDPNNNNNNNTPNNTTNPGQNTSTFYNVSSGNNFETNFSGNYQPGTAGHFQEFARGMNLDLGDFGASGTEWEGVDNNIGKFTTAAWDVASNAYRDYLERSGQLGNITGITEPTNLGGTTLPFRRRLSPDAGIHSTYTNFGKFDNAQDYYNSLPADQQQILKDNDPDVFGSFRRGSMVRNAMYGYGSKAKKRRRPRRKYQNASNVLSDKVIENYENIGINSDILQTMNVTPSDTLLSSTIYPGSFNYNSGAYEGRAGKPFYNPQLNEASSGVVMENLNMGNVVLDNSSLQDGHESFHSTSTDFDITTPVSRTDVTDDGTTRTTTAYDEEDYNIANMLKNFYSTSKEGANYFFDYMTRLNNENTDDESKDVYMKMKKEAEKKRYGSNVMSHVLNSRQRNQATADQRMKEFRNFMKNRK